MKEMFIQAFYFQLMHNFTSEAVKLRKKEELSYKKSF